MIITQWWCQRINELYIRFFVRIGSSFSFKKRRKQKNRRTLFRVSPRQPLLGYPLTSKDTSSKWTATERWGKLEVRILYGRALGCSTSYVQDPGANSEGLSLSLRSHIFMPYSLFFFSFLFRCVVFFLFFFKEGNFLKRISWIEVALYFITHFFQVCNLLWLFVLLILCYKSLR